MIVPSKLASTQPAVCSACPNVQGTVECLGQLYCCGPSHLGTRVFVPILEGLPSAHDIADATAESMIGDFASMEFSFEQARINNRGISFEQRNTLSRGGDGS